MKDMFYREIKPGDYIAYALLAGRSANQAVYRVVEVGTNHIRARKLAESYGDLAGRPVSGGPITPIRFVKWQYDATPAVKDFTPKTVEDYLKWESAQKVITLKLFERAIILTDFDPLSLLTRTEVR